ncbi:hypothetical protein PG999_003088 [Apiospora kogelbergensis]|uniref:CorA-like Mg2+ transporter protein n=1 Tax=Apiospora kogelbergensis TaxID=1337665 RepID=A0AAW0RAC7_9PEZI
MSLRPWSSRSGQSPKRTAQSRMSAALPTTLSGLLYHDTAEKAYLNDYGGGTSHFSKSSVADVFEVHDGKGGLLRERLGDDEMRDWLTSDTKARLRVLFIDALPEQPDLLPVTETLFRETVAAFDISPRFIDNLGRQHMPGREIRHRPDGSRRHEMWYTTVLRSDGTSLSYGSANPIAELTRQFGYWQRLCVWADARQQRRGREQGIFITYMILRCPREIKQALANTFWASLASSFLSIPCLFMHLSWTRSFCFRGISLHTALALCTIGCVSFCYRTAESATMSANISDQENKASELQTPNDYAERLRAFLALSRQIYQISTDYDILSASVEHLKLQSKWFTDMYLKEYAGDGNELEGRDTHGAMDDIFGQMPHEVSLLRTYSNLYLERSKIGIDECYALTNQRDSELNIGIAQASNQDNRSLRVIQILSGVFLPASFVSGIFGMGFFSTSDDGAVFVVNSRWWIYLAVAVPLTSVVLAVMVYYKWRDGNGAEQDWSRRISLGAASDADLEAASQRIASGKKRR